MNSTSRSALAWSLSLAALALGAAGCAGADEPEGWEAPPGSTPLGQFVAHVSPKTRTITFERLPSQVAADEGPARDPQAFTEATVLQDNTPGSGPVNTIELVTNGTPTVNAGCPVGFQSNTFCGNVTMRSFYTTTLNNVHLQATKITDTAGTDITLHSGVNSDVTIGSLSNALGLWKFTGTGAANGVLGPGGSGTAAGTRDLIFANPDSIDTNIYLHAYMTSTPGYGSYTMTAVPNDLAFVDACTGGTKILTGAPAGATATTAIPFAFTFYETTYASGSLVTVGRKGALGFGSQGATLENGANVSLPNSAGTTPKPGIFPFWDDQNYGNAPTGVCVITTGSAPSRKLSVTWSNMKFFGGPGATDHLTYSVTLNEGTDQIDIAYKTMTSLALTRAAGDSATIGVQNGAGTLATMLFNTTNSVGAGKGYKIAPVP